MMVWTVPYLIFDGTANDVLEYYKDVFEADNSGVQRYGDMEDFSGNDLAAKRLIHGWLAKDGVDFLLFSDAPEGMATASGDTVTIAFMFQDEASLKRSYDKLLSEAKSVHMELQETFWGATYANLTDKYGVHWQLNYQKETLPR
ncbi:hypothetical protein X560_0781 [Listeria fleischmannii 1991]|nr:hypothetical protein X560_0781 [Listeria fleischmannii 1991]